MRQRWQIKRLGEVCEVIAGQSPQGKYYNSDAVGLPFYQGKKEFGKKYIGEPTTWTTSVTKKACPGDILMSVRAPVGPVNFTDKNICIGRGLAAIRASNLVNSEFLFYFLLKHEKELEVNMGAVFSSINKTQIEYIKIPLPPLSEQQRIVSILDEVFAAIDRAKANTEKNLKSVKELFESYLHDIFEKKGDNWEEKMLGQIADVEYGYTDKSKDQGEYRYIRITDIDKNGELILDEKKYISYSKEAENFLIHRKDLLMARTGATFAKVLLFDGEEPSVFASYLIKIKFNVDIENEFYWYFTKTKKYWDQANNLQSGSAQPHFNGAAVKQVIFTYPVSNKEQKELIKKFQDMSIETKKLESVYQKKIEYLNELKKSLLHKAFTGELTKAEIPV